MKKIPITVPGGCCTLSETRVQERPWRASTRFKRGVQHYRSCYDSDLTLVVCVERVHFKLQLHGLHFASVKRSVKIMSTV